MSDTRIWMYQGEEAKIFNSPEDVPEGWTRRPVYKEVERPLKGDVEVGEPEKVEVKPKRKYNRKKR